MSEFECLAEVRRLGRKRARLLEQSEAVRLELEAAVRLASEAGVSGPRIALAAGFSHQRVYQLVAAAKSPAGGENPWP